MKTKRLIALLISVLMIMQMFAVTASASRNLVYCAPFGTATIDGVAEDAWSAADWTEIDLPYDGSLDSVCAARAKMMHDDSLIYFLVEITDATLANKDLDLTAMDQFEIYLDEDCCKDDAYCGNAYQLGMTLSEEVRAGTNADAVGAVDCVKEFKVGTSADGYTLEFSLAPLNGIPAPDKAIGLEFMYCDNNADGTYLEGLRWNVDTNNGETAPWQSLKYFGELVCLGSTLTGSRINKNVVYATPEIDGILNDGEWNNDSSIVINEENGITWVGETISEVVFYQAWDDNGLYIAGGIEDDDFCLAPSIAEVYSRDALQIALDPAGMLAADELSGGMFFSFGPMENGELGAVYHPYGGAAEAFEYTGAYSATDNGWQFEMMIPWTSIEILADDGYAWTHSANKVINALFCVLDRDEDGAVENLYMTAIDELSFSPSEYPYALKLMSEIESLTPTKHGNVAYASSDAITVDGAKDTAYADVTPIAVKYENGQAVADMTDGNANVYLATNNGLLYVYAEINDTEIVTPDSAIQTSEPWSTDSLEMFIHTDNYYQFRVDNSGYPSFYLNPNGDIAAYGPDAVTDYFVSYAAGEKDGGYTVEFCIDLKNFGVSSGTELGINFQLNDRAADGSQRFLHNGCAGSWDAHIYDTITVGAGESYEAVGTVIPTSGNCGDNLTWTLEDGVLTISGTGEMWWDPLGVVKSTIKAVVIEDGVTTIGGYAFSECPQLTSVTIGNDVKTIACSAFRGCPVLTEIVIPDSVETIELYAFEVCTALESVTIGDSVTFIGDAAFMDCTALKEISIPGSVQEIDRWAFEGCSALVSLTIENGVEIIDEVAFGNCPALVNVSIPNSVKEIRYHAFGNCPALESVTLGNSIISIAQAAFMDCVALKEVIIPDSVTEIGIWAFAGCTSLETLKLSSSLTKIGESAFLDNISLKSVEIPDSVEEIGVWAFANCSALETLKLGSGLTNLGACSFLNCTSLEKLSFANCNPVVGDWAFENCTALCYVDLGNVFTNIGVGMFNLCENLNAVYFSGNAPLSIADEAFSGVTSDMKFYYYEGSEGWTTPIWVDPNGHGYVTEMLPAGTDIPVESDKKISDLESIPFVDEDIIVVDGEKDSAYSNGAELLIYNRHADCATTGALASASMLTNNGLVYLYVDVIDPQVVEPTDEIHANAPWTADSIEFLFHANNNVHQFRVDVTDYLSYYRNHNGIIQAYGADAEKYFVAHKVVSTDTGYAIEFCVDSKMFGVSAGETIGVQMQLNDMTAEGGWSCYHYRATDHAFTVENFDTVQIGVNEKYKGQLEMLGTSIGDVPYIKPDRIVIDGKYSSVWDNALKVEIDQFNYGDPNASTRGTAYMYWTEGKWYLFVDVKDADVVAPDPVKQANEPWITDSVEMFFDFGHEHADLVKQFRIDCSGYPSYYTEGGADYAYGEAAKDYFDEYEVRTDDEGYNIEMVIDLAQWGLNPGDEIGIQLQINDVISEDPYNVNSCWNMHQSMGAGSWDADFYDYITLEAKVVEEPQSATVTASESDTSSSVAVSSAVIQGSAVTVEVDTESLGTIFDSSATEPDDEEDTGDTGTESSTNNTVTIDVTNVTTEISSEAETVQQVTIPAAVVTTIKKSAETNDVEDAKLAVHLTSGSIILDKATLDLINKSAETAEGQTATVSMVIDDTGDNLNETQTTALKNVSENEYVFSQLEISMTVTTTDDATGTATSENIHDFEGGTVQLEIPFEIPEGMDETGFTVYYIDEDGNLEAMETQYSNGKIIWNTTHFSDYIIMYKETVKESVIVDVNQMLNDLCEDIVDQLIDIGHDVQKVVEDKGRKIIKHACDWTINHVKEKAYELAEGLRPYLNPFEDDIKFIYHLFAD